MDRKTVSGLIETLNEYEKFLDDYDFGVESINVEISYNMILDKRVNTIREIKLNINSNNIVNAVIENIRIQANVIKDKLNQLGIQ